VPTSDYVVDVMYEMISDMDAPWHNGGTTLPSFPSHRDEVPIGIILFKSTINKEDVPDQAWLVAGSWPPAASSPEGASSGLIALRAKLKGRSCFRRCGGRWDGARTRPNHASSHRLLTGTDGGLCRMLPGQTVLVARCIDLPSFLTQKLPCAKGWKVYKRWKLLPALVVMMTTMIDCRIYVEWMYGDMLWWMIMGIRIKMLWSEQRVPAPQGNFDFI
jgi:hypothetical protein